MSDEEIGKLKVKVMLPGEWAAKKVLGPALEEMGEDFKKLYALGRDRIIRTAHRKIADPDDGKRANLRVARDVFWNGAFSESDICAEYFGGILASSRSEDGKDDDAIQFLDVIRSMSSTQLKLHYMVYTCLNRMLLQSSDKLNVASGADIQKRAAYFSWNEILGSFRIDAHTALNILHREGLLYEYKLDHDGVNDARLAYIMARPTTFGVFLFAAVHNKLTEWPMFGKQEFPEFPDVSLPNFFALSLSELRTLMNSS